MSRLKHYDNLGTARFITFSCYKRLQLLNTKEVADIFLQELEEVRKLYHFKIFAYVIMPSHIHMVIYPPNGMNVGRVIGQIKARSAYKIIRLWKKEQNHILQDIKVIKRGKARHALWLEKCYDHNCRTIDIVREKINYCHMNPVKAGLVLNPESWPWSSYRWHNNPKRDVVEIDSFEP